MQINALLLTPRPESHSDMGPGPAPSTFARLLGQSQHRDTESESTQRSNATASAAGSAEPATAGRDSTTANSESNGVPSATGALKRTAGRALGHHKPLREQPVGEHSALHNAEATRDKALRDTKAKDSDSELPALNTNEPAHQRPDELSAALMNAQVQTASGEGVVSHSASGSAATATAVAKEFAQSSSAARLRSAPGLGDNRAPAGDALPADRTINGRGPSSASASASALTPAPPASAAADAIKGTAASALAALAEGSRPLATAARRPADSTSHGMGKPPAAENLNAWSAMGGLMGSPGSPFTTSQAVASVNIPVPANAPEFREALGVQVSVLAADGVQQAELHLNPSEMGPISVRIVLDGSQAHVEFGADSAATRQIIEAGLPELASALREAGLTLSGGGVSQHAREPEVSAELTAQTQNNTPNGAQADPKGQQQQDDSRSQADGSAAADRGHTGRTGEGASSAALSAQTARQQARVSAGGVDVYA